MEFKVCVMCGQEEAYFEQDDTIRCNNCGFITSRINWEAITERKLKHKPTEE